MINPTYKQPGKQSFDTLLSALKLDILKNINCCKVGEIQSYDAAKQEAIIKIAYQQVTSTSPQGVQTFAEYPLLLNVPCYYPSGGGFTLTFPIAGGDECIVLFSDRQIDNWLLNGAGLPPQIGRVHDLSDGIALVGLRNQTRVLASVSTNSAQLRSDDGSTFVEVAGGGIVNVTAPTQINLNSPIVRVAGIIEVINENSLTNACTISGDIDLQGELDATGDVIANGISLHNHIHSDPQGGDTGPPL